MTIEHYGSVYTLETMTEDDMPSTPDNAAHPNAKQPSELPHLTAASEVHVVPVDHKPITKRLAVAEGRVYFSNDKPYDLIKASALKKGDVLSVARVAGIMAAKKTADLVPLCHNAISLEGIRVDLDLTPGLQHGPGTSEQRFESEWGCMAISCLVKCEAKTGVEMEALSGVVGAALTVVDMCKGVDKGLTISDVRVVRKEGGMSGSYSSLG